MHLTLAHRTLYSYERPVTYGLQQLRLTPKSRPNQKVLDWDIEITGGKIELEFEDEHMNTVTLISFDGDGHTIEIKCRGQVETTDTSGVIGQHKGDVPLWLFETPTDLTRAGNATRKLIKGLNADYEDPIERLHELSRRIHEAVKYELGHTHSMTSAEDALGAGHGVCQDHAHVFLAAARAMGMPARYISGYLMMNDRVDQDATHAWVEAHVDGIGWVGFDISNQISPDERYVRVATGLDYRGAAPIAGLRIGDHGQEKLEVDIQVQQ